MPAPVTKRTLRLSRKPPDDLGDMRILHRGLVIVLYFGMPTPDQALPGRDERMPVAARHFVLDAPLQGPFPDDTRQAMFGLGCFWGAERKFWQAAGVYTTAVGYAAGHTPNPTYEEVCSGLTGHNEVVLVVYQPEQTSPTSDLLKVFWESHDPTQGMRQGNDRGTQYRSGIYYLR